MTTKHNQSLVWDFRRFAPQAPQLKRYKERNKLLENSIKNLYDEKTELIFIEAGCCQKWPLNLAGNLI